MELRLLWEILKDRYKILVYVVAAFLIFPALLVIFIPNVYESTAYVMVKKADEYTSFVKELPQNFGLIPYIDSDNVLGSIDFFMRNEVLIDQVIRKCNLQDVISFSPTKFSDPGLISILFRRRGVGIEAEKDSEVFSIQGLSPDLKEAQKIANTFLDEFLRYYAAQKKKEIERAKSSYTRKAAELRASLLQIEQEELQYRTKHNVVDFDLQKQKLVDQLKELTDSRSELQTSLAVQLETYNSLLEAIARNPEYHKTSDTLAKNELIQFYKQAIAEQESQLAAKKLELTAEHPEIRTIQGKISSLKRLMNAEKEKVFSLSLTARNTYYDTLIQKREDHSIEVIKLKTSIEDNERQTKELTSQLNRLLEEGTGLLELVRRRSDLDTIYKSVDQAINSLEAVEGLDINNFLVINRASIVGRSKDRVYAPDAALFLALFGCTGLIGGLLLIFVLEYIDNAPRLFSSFERLTAGTRSISIQGRKGWPLLAAELARHSPQSIGVLNRGKRGELKPFVDRLVAELRSSGLDPLIVYVNGEYKVDHAPEGSLAIDEKDLTGRMDQIVQDSTREGRTAVFLLPPLSLSTAGYLAGDLFDLIVYVVKPGAASFEEIKSDHQFFADRSCREKVVGVFYAA